MKFRLVKTATAVIGLLTGTLSVDLLSQGVPQSSTALLVRKQLQEIADEVVAKLNAEPRMRVTVSAESQHPATLAQNAFLEALQRKGFQPFLGIGGDSVLPALTISVLNDKVAFEDVGSKSFLRTVELELEARIEFGLSKPAQYLGTFWRFARDTVQEREPEYMPSSRSNLHDDDSSTFQRIFGPLIVLASSVLVVYLFFTVRS